MTETDHLAASLAAKFAHGSSPAPWQFVLYGGLGDHVLWLSLLAAFRRQVQGKIVVYCDRRTQDLAQLYAGRSFDVLAECDALTPNDIRQIQTHGRFAPGMPILAWHCCYVGDEVSYLRHRDDTITSVVRHILRLPAAAPVARPLVSLAGHVDAQVEMTRRGLPVGRTVLLAPWAKSAQVTLPDAWWVELVALLVARGYTVATNTAMRGRGFDQVRVDAPAPALPGTIAVDVPLRAILPFSELCGTVVTVRSGLSDLLAFSRARNAVIWPYDPARETYFRKLFRIWSLQRLYPCHDLTEFHQPVAAAFDPAPFLGWLRALPNAG